LRGRQTAGPGPHSASRVRLCCGDRVMPCPARSRLPRRHAGRTLPLRITPHTRCQPTHTPAPSLLAAVLPLTPPLVISAYLCYAPAPPRCLTCVVRVTASTTAFSFAGAALRCTFPGVLPESLFPFAARLPLLAQPPPTRTGFGSPPEHWLRRVFSRFLPCRWDTCWWYGSFVVPFVACAWR